MRLTELDGEECTSDTFVIKAERLNLRHRILDKSVQKRACEGSD